LNEESGLAFTLLSLSTAIVREKPRMARYETDCLEMSGHRVNLSRGAARRVGLETEAKIYMLIF
jgi:hypothetical protein